jgi:hypothetical protein
MNPKKNCSLRDIEEGEKSFGERRDEGGVVGLGDYILEVQGWLGVVG